MNFFLWKQRKDEDLDTETQHHLDEAIRERMERGESAKQARLNAQREFGNVGLVKEVTRAMWGWAALERLWQDLRFGARMLRKHPVFTAMAVLSLALGIGANAAIFSLLDAALLKSLPVKQPEQLVFLEQNGAGEYKRTSNIRYPVFKHLREQNQVLSGVCAFAYVTRVSVKVDEQSEVIDGQLVTGGFFSVLGVQASAGRVFTEAEDKEYGGADVAVISHRFWQRRFAGNPAVVGQTVVLNNAPFTIIGVTPPEFFGVIAGNAPEIFLPALTVERTLPQVFHLRDGALAFVLGRLKPEVTETQSAAALTLLAQQAQLARAGAAPTAEERQAIQQQKMRLLPAHRGFSALRRQYSKPLRVLMAVVGLVLLIACANVANLLLARAAARRREIAVRLSLGASRWRLLRQLLTESLLLALLGGGLGLLLAAWCSGLLLNVLSSGRNPVSAHTTIFLKAPLDSRVLAFTALVSLLAVLLAGLLPAWQATRLDPSPALKDNTVNASSGARLSWGRILVVAQIALSLTLLVGAGLFLRSLSRLQHLDIGFNRENVLVFSVHPQLIGYEGERIARLYEQMLERIGALPGVRSATLAQQGLLAGGGTYGFIKIPGRTLPVGEGKELQTRYGTRLNVPNVSHVGPRFFETVGMMLLRGRDFTAQVHATARKVAVVDESFARYYFGNEDPIGQHFERDGLIEIVGLVKDAKLIDIQEDTRRTFYVPYQQDPIAWREMNFQVRTAGDPLQAAAAIRRAAQELEPNLALYRLRTLAAQVNESLGQERLVATLAGLFGALALLLASAGLYGVLSYNVSRRTHEFGIRLALGAPARNIRWLVLRETYGLTLCGIALGMLASLASGGLIAGMLYGLTPTDSLTMLVAVLTLLGVAALASWLPARRATKVDPLIALRHD